MYYYFDYTKLMKTQKIFLQLRAHLQSQIVGQHYLIERLLD